jgi:hypothetical protein
MENKVHNWQLNFLSYCVVGWFYWKLA